MSSKDENVKKELDAALAGVAKDDIEAFAAAVSKVAAAHGFTLTANDCTGEMKEISENELEAVAGGDCGPLFAAYNVVKYVCDKSNYF